MPPPKFAAIVFIAMKTNLERITNTKAYSDFFLKKLGASRNSYLFLCYRSKLKKSSIRKLDFCPIEIPYEIITLFSTCSSWIYITSSNCQTETGMEPQLTK